MIHSHAFLTRNFLLIVFSRYGRKLYFLWDFLNIGKRDISCDSKLWKYDDVWKALIKVKFIRVFFCGKYFEMYSSAKTYSARIQSTLWVHQILSLFMFVRPRFTLMKFEKRCSTSRQYYFGILNDISPSSFFWTSEQFLFKHTIPIYDPIPLKFIRKDYSS